MGMFLHITDAISQHAPHHALSIHVCTVLCNIRVDLETHFHTLLSSIYQFLIDFLATMEQNTSNATFTATQLELQQFEYLVQRFGRLPAYMTNSSIDDRS